MMYMCLGPKNGHTEKTLCLCTSVPMNLSSQVSVHDQQQ